MSSAAVCPPTRGGPGGEGVTPRSATHLLALPDQHVGPPLAGRLGAGHQAGDVTGSQRGGGLALAYVVSLGGEGGDLFTQVHMLTSWPWWAIWAAHLENSLCISQK